MQPLVVDALMQTSCILLVDGEGYPASQFHDGRVLEGLQDAITTLLDADWDPLQIARWLEETRYDERSAISLLREDDADVRVLVADEARAAGLRAEGLDDEAQLSAWQTRNVAAMMDGLDDDYAAAWQETERGDDEDDQ